MRYVTYFCMLRIIIFFFKQKTAYEMRISDWSSDVCSSDLFGYGVPSAERALRSASNSLALVAEQEIQPFRYEPGGTRLNQAHFFEIGRASCRERVCQYV